MPLSRFSKLPEAKQAELLRVATEELAEHGFEEASLSDLLERAGLSKSSFYYYFEDKEDLLATVLERLLDKYLAAFQLQDIERLTAETFWPTFERWMVLSVATLIASPDLMKVLSHLPLALRTSPKLAALQTRARLHMRSVIEVGQRLGCIRTDLSTDRLLDLWEGIDNTLDRDLIGRKDTPTRGELDAHMTLVLDLFHRLMATAGPFAVRTTG
jgi:AcrR family transcriptional regulator